MDADDDNQPSLTDFIDIATLQSLQDEFAKLTGIATSIRDPQGNPITHSAGQPEFCDVVRSTPAGEKTCRLSHAEAAECAEGLSEPCRHTCHAGLSHFVAPIIVDGRHLGALIVGDRPLAKLRPDELDRLSSSLGIPPDRLQAAADDLVPWADGPMRAAATFVQQLANTLAQLCYQAHQLRCRVDELAAVYEVSSKLAGRAELQEIMDTATQQLVEAMGLRAAQIRLLDEDSDVLRVASVANLSDWYLDKPPIQVSQSPIDQHALKGETVYVADLRTDPRTYYTDKAKEEGLVSALITALCSGGQRIGVLRAYMGRHYQFTPFDVSLLEAIASQVATAIMNARLHRDVEYAVRMERQVKQAAEVQRRMIPAPPTGFEHYQFGCAYEPSFDLGGDFYDFIPFANGDLGVAIADVVGKGIPASLVMASARSSLRSNARRFEDISQVMRAVNGRLCHDTLTGEFATAFYMELSADGKRVRFCNAGHEPMLLLRHGRVQSFDVGGLVLGIDSSATYEAAELALEPGDLLVLLTDGIVEAMDYDGQLYGRERLYNSIKLHGAMAPDMPVDLISKQLLWDVRRYAGLAPQSDDMSLVVTRVL